MKHVIINKTICPTLKDVKHMLNEEYKLCTTEQALPRALIIDGNSLIDIMGENGEAKEKLLQFSNMCRAVVGCRVSPDQKREMVTLIKVGFLTILMRRTSSNSYNFLSLGRCPWGSHPCDR